MFTPSTGTPAGRAAIHRPQQGAVTAQADQQVGTVDGRPSRRARSAAMDRWPWPASQAAARSASGGGLGSVGVGVEGDHGHGLPTLRPVAWASADRRVDQGMAGSGGRRRAGPPGRRPPRRAGVEEELDVAGGPGDR